MQCCIAASRQSQTGWMRSLWLELGYGYKHVLVDLQNQLRHRQKFTNVLQTCNAGAAVAEQALTYYQTYATPPEHIWSDLHQLYYWPYFMCTKLMKKRALLIRIQPLLTP